jgi:hypothetical protein
MELKMIECPKCGNDFPELRKIKYNYHVCVNCSTIEPVVGITTLEGTGDHTYNDLIIMPQAQFRAIAIKAAEIAGQNTFLDALDLDSDDFETIQDVKEATTKVLDKDKEEDEEEEESGTHIQGIDY